MDKIWQVADRHHPDIWEHILALRGLNDPVQQQLFFSPSLDQLISPWDFPDMQTAVNRVSNAIASQEPIVIWGDFDADGVTSTAIVWETLHKLGAQVLPYIPSRDNEGHGFSQSGLASLSEKGTKLIITVDHGITAFADVQRARELGMDVIITDHHEPAMQQPIESNGKKARLGIDALDSHSLTSNYSLPDCVAVIHPFLLATPQKLAGCGVAYQFAYAIWLNQLERRDAIVSRQEFSSGAIELAALGTIADMMPLRGDNRILAALGLVDLPVTKRVGLQQLYAMAGMKAGQQFGVYDVGFMIAPRLNAPGRLADALASLRLLCVKNIDAARPLAVELEALNTQRQEMLARVTKEAKEALLSKESAGAYVLANPSWPAGVCGLAAGKLVEQIYRPVMVMEEQGETCRGSARSIKGFDITEALTAISDLLLGFGGHAMAAGFVAKTKDVPEIETRLSDMVLQQLTDEQLVPRLHIDAEVSLQDLTFELVEKMQQLEPCGMDNPQPLFMTSNVNVISSRSMGKDAKHLRLVLADESSHATIEAVAFGFGHLVDELLNSAVDVAFYLEKNNWNGSSRLQMKVRDIKQRN